VVQVAWFAGAAIFGAQQAAPNQGAVAYLAGAFIWGLLGRNRPDPWEEPPVVVGHIVNGQPGDRV